MEQPNRNEKDPYGIQELTEMVQDVARSLAHTVGDGLNEGARNLASAMGSSINDGANAVRSALKKNIPQITPTERRMKRLRKKEQDQRGTALGLGITTFVFMALTVLGILEAETDMIGMMMIFVGAFGIPTVINFFGARKTRRLINYRNVLNDRSYARMDELSAATGNDINYVYKDVQSMIRSGALEGASISPDGKRVFENQVAYRAYCSACEAAQQNAQQTRQEAEKPSAPNSESATMQDCRNFLRDLRKEKKRIDDTPVLEQVEVLEKQAELVIQWLEKKPASEPAIKRFSGYYMPTTIKLLHTYNEVDAQADQSAVASDIQKDICGILYTINKAFLALQDSFLKDTALDVSAEISAMEAVLAQDGLTEDGLLSPKLK